jgi:hypothetical protein
MLPAALLRAVARRSGGGAASTSYVRGLAAAASPEPAPETITCIVNGQEVTIPKGANVMAACTAANVDIPRCERLERT